MAPIRPIPHKNQTPQRSLPPQPIPKPIPKGIQTCFDCQAFGHSASDFTNYRYVTLAEWKAVEEAELEEENEENDEDNF